MSDEYQPELQTPLVVVDEYSPFWPMAVLIIGLILWTGYQAFVAYGQNAALAVDLKNAQPTITAAQNAKARLSALAQDLVQTSAKDPYAAQIVKEANLRIQPNGNTGH